MTKKVIILLFFILCSAVLFAQNLDIEPEEAEIKPREDFFIGISASASLYSAFDFAYGGGLTIGYGTGTVLGLSLLWFLSAEEIDTLEFSFFLRFYFFGKDAYSGPYIQLMGGPAIFFDNGYFNMPARVGDFSGGVGFGWRFVMADRWFIEPYVRGGYPYLIGGSITAGIRL